MASFSLFTLHPAPFILASLLALALVLGWTESRRHRRRLFSIPIRVHVNGTRGKSSVTRLIGAGLRAGGLRTLVKVTGTLPKLVLENGDEIDIYRRGGANILEQLDIVRFAASRDAEVLVIECMALDPVFQWVTEHRIVRSTLSVLTNVRLDHCDVMGDSLEEIAEALSGTIPNGGLLISGEREIAPTVERLAEKRGTSVVVSDPATVRSEEIRRFSYLEHEENVALALRVCAELGVDREVALQGMIEAEPDSGVLTHSAVESPRGRVELFNAFAANDPDSTLRIWRLLDTSGRLADQRAVLLNTRDDRADRTRQLTEMLAEDLRDHIDRAVVMGTGAQYAVQRLNALDFPSAKIVDLGDADAETVVEALQRLVEGPLSVVAVGNMGGAGGATVDLFQREARSSASTAPAAVPTAAAVPSPAPPRQPIL